MDYIRSVFAALFAAEILWPFLGFVAPCRKWKRLRQIRHTPRSMTLAQGALDLRSASLHVVGHTLLLRRRNETGKQRAPLSESSCGLSEAKPGKLEGSLELPGDVQLRPLCKQTGADEDLMQT